jgi:hypothetical protein
MHKNDFGIFKKMENQKILVTMGNFSIKVVVTVDFVLTASTSISALNRTSIKKLIYGDGYLSPQHFDPLLLKRFLAAEKTIKLLYNSGRLDN